MGGPLTKDSGDFPQFYEKTSVLVLRLTVFELHFFFFFQAEDGIRDRDVTGVQTCALPISRQGVLAGAGRADAGLVHAPGGPFPRPIQGDPEAVRAVRDRSSARAVRRGDAAAGRGA